MAANRYIVWVGAAIACGMIPAALASKSGAELGHNGGAAGFGRTCAACHFFATGSGRVEIIGLPRRYRAGATYDVSVRVADAAKVGAGFEVSAETAAGHQGSLLVTDMTNTDFAGGEGSGYLTHTRDGVEDSLATWAANGASYDYHFGWQAPGADVGRITFFAAGNATNDATSFVGENYYAEDMSIPFAVPGDADGDTDVDVFDWSSLQNCFGQNGIASADACAYVDMSDDGAVDADDAGPWNLARTGPTAALPAGYVLADAFRGGKLYQHWWLATRTTEPSGTHPLYPPEGIQAGAVTFECNECHGWDYQGSAGVYATGDHFTGIQGVLDATLGPQEIFDLLKADPAVTPNGHDMDAYGMTDRDLWDVTRMVLEGVVDTNDYIAGDSFTGSLSNGFDLYSLTCAQCHGEDGRAFSFSRHDGEFVGTTAVENPWRFLHVIRYGHPGSPMPGTDVLRWDVQWAADVGAYSQTLPTQ